MEVTTFVISCVAFVLSVGSLGWQVWSWRHDRRFDVRARIKAERIEVASGKLEVTVVVENHGATHEAVEEVWLMYSHHLKRGEVSADSLPSVRVRLTRERGDLPPRRNVRQTVDVLAAQFLEQVPEEITAMVTLESGERITTEALPIAKQRYETALGRPLRGPR